MGFSFLSIRKNCLSITTILLGAISSYIIAWLILPYFGNSIVLSTCLAGLLGSFLFVKNTVLQQQFYCGCFIAMSSRSLLHRLELTIVSIIVASIVFNLSTIAFKGHGGKLGAIAFTGTVIGFMWII